MVLKSCNYQHSVIGGPVTALIEPQPTPTTGYDIDDLTLGLPSRHIPYLHDIIQVRSYQLFFRIGIQEVLFMSITDA